MGENKYNINLASMNDVFNNKTFIYRINGFAHACNMRDVGVLGNSGVLFNTTGLSDDVNSEDSYFIAVNEKNNQLGKIVILNGHYHGLSFNFTNYYNKEKLDKKIIDLPFSISLEKKIDKDTYKFDIETVEGIRTKFYIVKYCEFKDCTLIDDVTFYANVMDFSLILKLVKSFVFNPMLVFNTYNEINQKYKCAYTNNDLEKAIIEDETLNKPMSKIKKILKKKMG